LRQQQRGVSSSSRDYFLTTGASVTIDLVPFGFTPTESLVYSELVTRGPTTAYGLAKVIGIARANTYQAFNGLVAKGAAVLISDSPQVFKPIAPHTLLAIITARESKSLDALEDQIRWLAVAGQPGTVEFTGQRALGELVLRTAVRANFVSCLAPGTTLTTLIPIWRKRAADGAATNLWSVGPEPHGLPRSVRGTIEASRIKELFGGEVVCLLTPDKAILGRWDESNRLGGFWSSDPLLVGCVRCAISAITEEKA
jgi:sugar-specific transcriptional regulator TrmB